jgi:hypothetical protein
MGSFIPAIGGGYAYWTIGAADFFMSRAQYSVGLSYFKKVYKKA